MKAQALSHVLGAVALVVGLGWDRLILALALIGSVVYLAAADKVGADAAVALLSAILGFVFGVGSKEAGAAATADAVKAATDVAAAATAKAKG